MGTLYIVSTPIGNLKDISFRALETLKSVDAILCEDTRVTGRLLSLLSKNYHIDFSNRPKLLSYFEQNEGRRIPEAINALRGGLSLALVSDAGTPTVSDPGFKLIRECIAFDIPLEVIPGASALLCALVISGLPTDKFLFLGFLPQKKGNRKKLLQNAFESQKLVKSTAILFEASHKLLRTLEELKEVFGDREIVVCRELTKMHQEVIRKKISEAVDHFLKNSIKGEFVLLIHKGA